MTKVDYSPEAVSARLREVARLTDLSPEKRLDYKIDYSPEAVSRRLRKASALRDACRKLVAVGEANGLGRARGGSDPSGAD